VDGFPERPYRKSKKKGAPAAGPNSEGRKPSKGKKMKIELQLGRKTERIAAWCEGESVNPKTRREHRSHHDQGVRNLLRRKGGPGTGGGGLIRSEKEG